MFFLQLFPFLQQAKKKEKLLRIQIVNIIWMLVWQK